MRSRCWPFLFYQPGTSPSSPMLCKNPINIWKIKTSPAKIMVQQLSSERLMRKLGRDSEWLTCYISFLLCNANWISQSLIGLGGRGMGIYFAVNFIILVWFIWYLKYVIWFHLQNDKITIQFYKKWEKPRKLPHFVELLEIENIGEHQLFGLESGVWRIKGYRSCWCW